MYFEQRLRPVLRTLLEAAAAAGEVRTDINADDILGAVASVCIPSRNDGHAQRMVTLLTDGLRCGL